MYYDWTTFEEYGITFEININFITKNIPISGTLLYNSVPSIQGVPTPFNKEEIAASTQVGFSADRQDSMNRGISQSDFFHVQ